MCEPLVQRQLPVHHVDVSGSNSSPGFQWNHLQLRKRNTEVTMNCDVTSTESRDLMPRSRGLESSDDEYTY
jgi:hypothetical protein